MIIYFPLYNKGYTVYCLLSYYKYMRILDAFYDNKHPEYVQLKLKCK